MTVVTGDWLTDAGTQTVMAMLENGGHQAYAVGGCVRNALLNVPVSDVDISTDARPDRVIELAKACGLKSVPTGIDHGTVTVVAHGVGYEITTFRADVETDGRRAVVMFADDIAQDAVRRDFTINALYADRRGVLIDPLGGLPDLHARHLRFIQDADLRIREDYLRILRFFRFSAFYGDPDNGMDADALAAIAANLDGLETLSRERVGIEMSKLLSADDPLMAVSVMSQTGVLARIMPGASPKALGPLLGAETILGLKPAAIRRLAALGFYDGASLRLSRADQARLERYQTLIGDMTGAAEIAFHHDAEFALDIVALRSAVFENLPDPDVTDAIARGASATFPVNAKDLMPELNGQKLGAALRTLQTLWIASDFSLTKDELISLLPKG